MIQTKCLFNLRWSGQNNKKNETNKMPNDNKKSRQKANKSFSIFSVVIFTIQMTDEFSTAMCWRVSCYSRCGMFESPHSFKRKQNSAALCVRFRSSWRRLFGLQSPWRWSTSQLPTPWPMCPTSISSGSGLPVSWSLQTTRPRSTSLLKLQKSVNVFINLLCLSSIKLQSSDALTL